MGRQWLYAKRMVAGLKKGRVTGKLVREISVAAKMGGADPEMNPRLFAAIEKAKKESVSRDAIDRAIKKGAGIGDEKLTLEHMVFEGYAPNKVAVIVEAYTDNVTRTTPEIRVLFRKGQLGTTGSNKFLFNPVGIVEAYHSDVKTDREAAAIESGADDFVILTSEQNDDIPSDVAGCRFLCDRSDVHKVSKWLSENSWTVITAEQGYVPKQMAELSEEQKSETGEFLQALDDHDDVHRVWAAME
ncbi:MAG: YebC/PmpR family DNA-binding transcriptional regulator [Deltaproteobacteria bacterium]|nr:YebC/PmpR family DNA-binding transcriptional regulator [Deltaproteobacteria bacterium]